MNMTYFHDTFMNRMNFIYTGPYAPPDPAERFDGYDRPIPKRTAMRPRIRFDDVASRERTHNKSGRQSGTASEIRYDHYIGSHGWRGRK